MKLTHLICMLTAATIATTASARDNDPSKATCYLFHGDKLKLKERCVVVSGWAMGEGWAAFTIKGTEFIERTFTARDNEGNFTDGETNVLEINGKSYDAQYIHRNRNLNRKSPTAKFTDEHFGCYLIKPKRINVCYKTD